MSHHPPLPTNTEATQPAPPLQSEGLQATTSPLFQLMWSHPHQSTDGQAFLFWPSPQQSELYRALNALHERSDAHFQMRREAQYFLNDLKDLPPEPSPFNRLEAAAAWVKRQEGVRGLPKLIKDVEHLMATGLFDLFASDAFQNVESLAWSQLCALILAGSPNPDQGNQLMSRVRICAFLRRLSQNDTCLERQSERVLAMAIPIVFPDEVIPQPAILPNSPGWARIAGLSQANQTEPCGNLDETQTIIPGQPQPDMSDDSQWFTNITCGPQSVSGDQRLLVEFIVNDPAGNYRQDLARKHGIHMDPVPSLGSMGVEGPRDINRKNYQELNTVYRAGDPEPPPAMTRILKAGFHGPGRVQTRALLVPSGYHIQSGRLDYRIADGSFSMSGFADSAGFCHRGYERGNTVKPAEGGRELHFKNPNKQAVPIVVECAAPQFKVDIRITVEAERGQELYRAWQARTYDRIVAAYEHCQQEYESWFQIYFQHLSPDQGQLIRSELEKSAGHVLSQRRFLPLSPGGSRQAPEPGYARVFNHAFEWADLTYTFLPWRRGESLQWPNPVSQASQDFEGFLRTQTARLLVPVRPGYEMAILYYILYGYLWPPLEGAPPVSADAAAAMTGLLINRPVQRMQHKQTQTQLPQAAGQ